MPEKHLSTQFDSELSAVSSRVLELGGLVESQIIRAILALSHFSVELANEVTATEARVNAMEVDIDRELSSIIARRQPTARDLRLLIAISKTTANLERVGDEAEKIASMVRSIMMEDPRMISPSLDLLFLAKAIERIGDHAKNIAEFIIYVVKGADVRHTPMEQIESVVK